MSNLVKTEPQDLHRAAIAWRRADREVERVHNDRRYSAGGRWEAEGALHERSEALHGAFRRHAGYLDVVGKVVERWSHAVRAERQDNKSRQSQARSMGASGFIVADTNDREHAERMLRAVVDGLLVGLSIGGGKP